MMKYLSQLQQLTVVHTAHDQTPVQKLGSAVCALREGVETSDLGLLRQLSGL